MSCAMCDEVCAALIVTRSLAEPLGTVGGRIAGTHNPDSANRADHLTASALSPIKIGCIGVSEGINSMPGGTSRFNAATRARQFARKSVADLTIDKLANVATAKAGGCAVVNR